MKRRYDKNVLAVGTLTFQQGRENGHFNVLLSLRAHSEDCDLRLWKKEEIIPP